MKRGDHIRIFQNYHRHSEYTNTRISDSVVTNADYAKKALELGHGIISTCEHGYQGRYIDGHELGNVCKNFNADNPECQKCSKFNYSCPRYQRTLAFVFGAEAYWVRDRFEKDRTNCHIYLGARNENGRQAINDILSEANLTGYYGQARLDPSLILSLPPKDVIVTTACVAFWQYDDVDDFVSQLNGRFKDNFFLEVQYHNTDKQRELNRRILQLHNDLKIPLIMGCDSHYIDAPQHQDRTDFLVSKGMNYPDEEGWYLDYVDGDTAYQRFANQCVLSDQEICDAMDNTDVFLEVERYDNPCFDTNIKLPSIYPDASQEEKDDKYKSLIWSWWDTYKHEVPQEQWSHYEDELSKEVATVVDTKMSDYFLANHKIIERGKANGGWLTKTGRGSAVSFLTNKALGFTEVDRIASSVKMYPERFMSTTRILESGSIPDIDYNVAPVEPFARAQQEVLGEDHAYPMIAYGTMKTSAAWKLYAKSQGIPFEIANNVSAQIARYEKALKHAEEDEKDTIDVFDYIEPQYKNEFLKSKDYLGTIVSWSIAPCSYLLYQGSIRKEIGLVKIKDHICCLMDGHWAETYHFLKNDLLKVAVVDLIYRTFKRIGIEPFSTNELLKKCPPEDKAWDIYKRGCTLGINQCEQAGTSARVVKYQPRNISELCAFVAAIRPGFKSMYKIFEERKPFKYNIKAFDDLIQTEEMPSSFVLYQEMEMAALNYAGIPMSECYTAVKNIAKKRVEKVLQYKEKFIKGFSEAIIRDENKNQEEAQMLAEQLWQIIQDSSRYSFNACLSGDTVLMRAGERAVKYKPTIEEMYLIKNDRNFAKEHNHLPLRSKYLRQGYGNALSMFDDQRIRKNQIVDIRYAGVQDIYRVEVDTGESIDCTMNHKFPTPNGLKHLSELSAGDLLYVCGNYEKNTHKYTLTDGNFTSNAPTKGQCGFQHNPNGNYVKYSEFRERCKNNKLPCDICKVSYDANMRFEVHHKDMDRTNNDESNFAWLCVSCHKKEHYKNSRTKAYEKGLPTLTSQIVSIKYLRTDKTYDVEMADPAHTIVTSKGIVTSNSHADCVALDSLYCSWLKAHYPVEFYESFLNLQSEKGNKDKLTAAKREAETFFKIKFPPLRFRQDNRSIIGIPEENSITNSISSIKGFGSIVGDKLYEVGQNRHETFMDALKDLGQHGIKASKVMPLIKIDYFAEFGNAKELLRVLDVFEFFKQGTSKTVNKEKVADSPFKPIIEKYSNGLTSKGQEAKSYTIQDMTSILNECEAYIKSLHIADFDYKNKIQNQQEILGYIDLTTNKEDDRSTLLVTGVNALRSKDSPDPWAYAVFTRSIGSGKEGRFTVYRKIYDNDPIRTSDIIKAKGIYKNKSGWWYLQDYQKQI